MNHDGAAKEIIPIINPIVKILAVEGKSKQVSGGAGVCTPQTCGNQQDYPLFPQNGTSKLIPYHDLSFSSQLMKTHALF